MTLIINASRVLGVSRGGWEFEVTAFLKPILSVAAVFLTLLAYSLPSAATLTAGVGPVSGIAAPARDALDNAEDTINCASTGSPLADSYVRDGVYSNVNYGLSTELITKSGANSAYSRESYLKFDVSSVGGITSAKLRLYGRLLGPRD